MEYIIWPFVAHPDDNRTESYEWNSTVLKGPQFEQRISFRDVPVFTCEVGYELNPTQLGQARLLAEAVFRANNRLLLPLWSERVFPTTTFYGSINQIEGDFRFVRFDAPAKALLWFSENEYYELAVTAVLPDRIFIEEVTFADFTGRKCILLPLLEGRPDGDITFAMKDTKKHFCSFTFKASEERNHRYVMNLCFCLDGSGSMAGSRVNNLNASLHTLLDYLITFAESSLIDLSIRMVYCLANGNGPRRDWKHLRDADKLQEMKDWIVSVGSSAGAFSFQDAANKVAEWYDPDAPGTNIAMIMTDADDATEAVIEECELILADILDYEEPPFSVYEGTAVNLYAVGIDSSNSSMTLFNRLTNVGDAIRLVGSSLAQFNSVLQGITFGPDTPLASFPELFTTYQGLAVPTRKILREQGVNEVLSRARTGFLTPSGIDWYTDQRIINELDYMLHFELLNPAQLQAVLIWMHSVRGQKREFWHMTQNRDIIMTVPQPDTEHIHIRRSGLDNPMRLLEEPIVIETTRGEMLYRRFVNAAYIVGDRRTFRMTLNATTPRLLRPRDVVGIYTLRKVRFATDLAQINHEGMLQTRIAMAISRVSEPFVPPPVPVPEPPWPPGDVMWNGVATGWTNRLGEYLPVMWKGE